MDRLHKIHFIERKVRGYDEYNSWNSCEQQLDTGCFVRGGNSSVSCMRCSEGKTGGTFLRITQNGESVQLLSSSCRALVRRQASVQRGGARARWTRTVVFLPFFGHTVVSSLVIAFSVIVSCATDIVTSHAWLK